MQIGSSFQFSHHLILDYFLLYIVINIVNDVLCIPVVHVLFFGVLCTAVSDLF